MTSDPTVRHPETDAAKLRIPKGQSLAHHQTMTPVRHNSALDLVMLRLYEEATDCRYRNPAKGRCCNQKL